MSRLNKNQIKATNQTSIVSYEDDDCEDIALNQRHSMSSGKRRSEQHAPRPEYSSHIERVIMMMDIKKIIAIMAHLITIIMTIEAMIDPLHRQEIVTDPHEQIEIIQLIN
uniref:Uncharacterized protein LOC113791525 n=1 Tax=Dermatophagoides pteronyssinus TaxID=6956 RepID=A0A6P6XUZ8_DERPT|nr:uncharacterized protein LOC113791525 [Dermatophagoides pteronyssinus]